MWWGSCFLCGLNCFETVPQYSLHVFPAYADVEIEDYVSILGEAAP